ncbi:hypothetical protein Sste5346_004968 [Sporothrix stenoceras]|uniref:Zn(2)-C6 fungal-type domain-containing protein n=1 Tax=Sporothrix stenoceras TaxID=5173 RepID=A0ABR3Z709_9PEZI
MFLTFDSAQPSAKDDICNAKEQQPTARRTEHLHRRRRHSTATVRACTSCRQRKIKCDGHTPCEACRWYKKAEQCRYVERERVRERETPNPPAQADYRGALARLFPEVDPDSIVGLSKEDLLSLLAKPTDGSHGSHGSHGAQYAQPQPQDSATVATSSSVETSPLFPLSLERPGLETLHSIPDQHDTRDEAMSGTDASATSDASDASEEHIDIADDVNALSLPARHLSSYLGVSSMQAALKVLVWLHPELHARLSSLNNRSHQQQSRKTYMPGLQVQATTEQQLLDAYFVHFQPLAPLMDEASCRATFLSGHRKDDRWLALRNILLALGSISISAAGVDSNHDHRAYFARSMRFLNFHVLGSPSLEAIQTLGLMGGWYCHYISQPNLAYALMGVALRMAVTLGLQHEPPLNTGAGAGAGYQEHKRRIWWSLCCLETWGQETLGRPSMDVFGASITVKLPQMLDKENYMTVLPLVENVHFIKIAFKIQQSLTALPTLAHADMDMDMLSLDTQLLQWWTSLPSVLKDYTPCPEPLLAARTVMRWRFYNQRILLYRPKLLNYAMCRIPVIAIKDEERIAVQRCGDIARVAIDDIAATTATAQKMSQMTQMLAWNAVWMIFQATMVPLILLAAAANNDDAEACKAYKAQVETAMAALDRMRPYGHTVERSLGMISGILETLTLTPVGGTTNNDPPLNAANSPLVLAGCQPVTQGRVPDWAAATVGTAGAAVAAGAQAPFENYSSQQMWEYLSWAENDVNDENSDFWHDLYSSWLPQEGASSSDARIP